MISIAILFVALLALWLFIRIDQRRLKDSKLPSPSKTSLNDGFTPGLTDRWMPYAGIAATCVLSAIGGVVTPEAPPFTGRWAGARELLYSAFGPYGWSGVFTVAAIPFAIQALTKYKEGAVQRRRPNVS